MLSSTSKDQLSSELLNSDPNENSENDKLIKYAKSTLKIIATSSIETLDQYVDACKLIEDVKEKTKSEEISGFARHLKKEILVTNSFHLHFSYKIRMLMNRLNDKLNQLRFEGSASTIATINDAKLWLMNHLDETKELTDLFTSMVDSSRWLFDKPNSCVLICTRILSNICEQLSHLESMINLGWILLNSIDKFLEVAWQDINVKHLKETIIENRTRFISKSTKLPVCMQSFAINVIKFTENIQRSLDLIDLLKSSHMSDDDWMKVIGSLNLYSRFSISDLLKAQSTRREGTNILIEHIAKLALEQRKLLDLVDNARAKIEKCYLRIDSDYTISELRDIDKASNLISLILTELDRELYNCKETELSASEAVRITEQFIEQLQTIKQSIVDITNESESYIRSQQNRISRLLDIIYSRQRRLKPLIEQYITKDGLGIDKLSLSEIANNISITAQNVDKINSINRASENLSLILYDKCPYLMLLDGSKALLAKAMGCGHDKLLLYELNLMNNMFDNISFRFSDSIVTGFRLYHQISNQQQLFDDINFENEINPDLILWEWIDRIVEEMKACWKREVLDGFNFLKNCRQRNNDNNEIKTHLSSMSVSCLHFTLRAYWTLLMENALLSKQSFDTIFEWIENVQKLIPNTSECILNELLKRTQMMKPYEKLCSPQSIQWKQHIRAYIDDDSMDIAMYSNRIPHMCMYTSCNLMHWPQVQDENVLIHFTLECFKSNLIPIYHDQNQLKVPIILEYIAFLLGRNLLIVNSVQQNDHKVIQALMSIGTIVLFLSCQQLSSCDGYRCILTNDLKTKHPIKNARHLTIAKDELTVDGIKHDDISQIKKYRNSIRSVPINLLINGIANKSQFIECLILNNGKTFRLVPIDNSVIKLYQYPFPSTNLITIVIDCSRPVDQEWMEELMPLIKFKEFNMWYNGQKLTKNNIRIILEYGDDLIVEENLKRTFKVVSLARSKLQYKNENLIKAFTKCIQLTDNQNWWTMPLDRQLNDNESMDNLVDFLLNLTRAYVQSNKDRLDCQQIISSAILKDSSLQIPSDLIENSLWKMIYDNVNEKWLDCDEIGFVPTSLLLLSEKMKNKASLVVGTKLALNCFKEILIKTDKNLKQLVLLDENYNLIDEFVKDKVLYKTLLVCNLPKFNHAEFIRCLWEQKRFIVCTESDIRWQAYPLTSIIILANVSDFNANLNAASRRLLSKHFQIIGLPFLSNKNRMVINTLGYIYPNAETTLVEMRKVVNQLEAIMTFEMLKQCCYLVYENPSGNIKELTEHIISENVTIDKLQIIEDFPDQIIPYSKFTDIYVRLKHLAQMKNHGFVIKKERVGCGSKTILNIINKNFKTIKLNSYSLKQDHIAQIVVNHTIINREPIFVICDLDVITNDYLKNTCKMIQWSDLEQQDIEEILEHLVKGDNSQMLSIILTNILNKIDRGCLFTIPMIRQFCELYQMKFEEVQQKSNKNTDLITRAIEKIKQIAAELEQLKIELEKKRLELADKKHKCELIEEQMQKLSELQSNHRDHIIDIKHKVDQKVFTAEREKRQAEEELSEALPILEKAKEALESLSKDNIAEMRSFTKPPKAVHLVGSCIATYLSSKQKLTDWKGIRKLMGEPTFLSDLQTRSPSEVTNSKTIKILIKQLHQLLGTSTDEDLLSQMKLKSVAAAGLLEYVLAVDKYLDAYKLIQPRLQDVDILDKHCKKGKDVVESLQKDVQKIDNRIKKYTEYLTKAQAEQFEIETQSNLMEAHTSICERLLNSLNIERHRWTVELEKDTSYQNSQALTYALLRVFSGHLSSTVKTSLSIESILFEDINPSMEPNFVPAQFAPIIDPLICYILKLSDAIPVIILIDPYHRMKNYLQNLSFEHLQTIDSNALLDSIKLGHKIYVSNEKPENVKLLIECFLQNQLTKHQNFKLIITIQEYDSELLSNFLANSQISIVACYGTGIEQYSKWAILRNDKPKIYEDYVKIQEQMISDIKIRNELDEVLQVELCQSSGNILDNASLLKTLEETSTKSNTIESRLKAADNIEQKILEEMAKSNNLCNRFYIFEHVLEQIKNINKTGFVGIPLHVLLRIVDKSLEEFMLSEKDNRNEFVFEYIVSLFLQMLALCSTKEEFLVIKFLFHLSCNDEMSDDEELFNVLIGNVEQPLIDSERLIDRKHVCLANINRFQDIDLNELDEVHLSRALPDLIDQLALKCFLQPTQRPEMITEYLERNFEMTNLAVDFDFDSLISLSDSKTPVCLLVDGHQESEIRIPCRMSDDQQSNQKQTSLLHASSYYSEEEALQINAAHGLTIDQLEDSLAQCQSRGRWMVILNAHLLSSEIEIIKNALEGDANRKFRLWLVLMPFLSEEIKMIIQKSIRIRLVDNDKDTSTKNSELEKVFNILRNQSTVHGIEANYEQIVRWFCNRFKNSEDFEEFDVFIRELSCGTLCHQCHQKQIEAIVKYCVDRSRLIGLTNFALYSTSLPDRLFENKIANDRSEIDKIEFNKILFQCLLSEKEQYIAKFLTTNSIIDLYKNVIYKILKNDQTNELIKNEIEQILMDDYLEFRSEVKLAIEKLNLCYGKLTLIIDEPFKNDQTADEYFLELYRRYDTYSKMLPFDENNLPRLAHLCNPKLFLQAFLKIYLNDEPSSQYSAFFNEQPNTFLLRHLKLINANVINNKLTLSNTNQYVDVYIRQSIQEDDRVNVPLIWSKVCKPLIYLSVPKTKEQSQIIIDIMFVRLEI